MPFPNNRAFGNQRQLRIGAYTGQQLSEEGNSALTPQNVAIKLVFLEKIGDPASIKANAGLFSIVDEDGKPVEFEPLYNEENIPMRYGCKSPRR